MSLPVVLEREEEEEEEEEEGLVDSSKLWSSLISFAASYK